MQKSKNDIITELARKKTFETIISKHRDGGDRNVELEDLAQDLYLMLLKKPELYIQELYYKGTIEGLQVKMVINAIKSNSSQYARMKAKRRILYNQPLTVIRENIENADIDYED